MDKIVETTAEQIIVDLPAPPTVTFDKKILLGTLAGLTVGAGATLLALELKKRKARKDDEKINEELDNSVNPIKK